MLLEGTLGQAPKLAQVHEVLSKLVLRDPVGGRAEMDGHMPHHPHVGILRAFR